MRWSMAMSRALCGTLMGLVLVSWAAAQPRTPGASVDELLAYARQNSRELAAMRYEAEAAGERIEPAGAFPDPFFRLELENITNNGNTSVQLSPANVGQTKYLVMQPLPFFGKRGLRRAVAEADASAARSRVDESWAELAMRIKAGYARLWQLARTEALTREVVALMANLEQVAQARYAGGLAAQQDAIRAQTERTGMEGELITLAAEQRQAAAALNGLLARPARAPLAEPERLRPVPAPAQLELAALADRVAGRNPTLAVETARIAAAENNRELTYRNRFPDFSIGVQPVQMGNRIGEWDLMLEVAIPLQQGTRRSQEREAERMLDAARLRREAALARLANELAGAVAALESARQTELLIAARLLPQAQLTFESALAGYETGKVDFATLLEAQRQIRKARADVVKAQAEQQVRLAELERIVGEEL